SRWPGSKSSLRIPRMICVTSCSRSVTALLCANQSCMCPHSNPRRYFPTQLIFQGHPFPGYFHRLPLILNCVAPSLFYNGAPMSLAPGTKLGPYEIQALLGAGGMGEVYRARDTRLQRDVAVKVLPNSLATDKDRLRRFEQEARAVAALNHPNLLTVFKFAPTP